MSNTTIPGDPGGLHALASQLSGAAADIEGIAARVAANELGGWIGAGGDAYRAAVNQFPGALHPVSDSMSVAAGGISSFASQLETFQYTAARLAAQIAENADEQVAAEARHLQASAHAASARTAHSIAHDPVTIQVTKRALAIAEDAASAAAGVVESLAGDAARLAAEAAANFAAYRSAVQACIAALSGGLPAVAGFLGAGAAAAEALAGEIDKALVYARRDGAQVAEDGADGPALLKMLELFGPGLGVLPVGMLFASPRTWTALQAGVDWVNGNKVLGAFQDRMGDFDNVDELASALTDYDLSRFVPASGDFSALDRDFSIEAKLSSVKDLPGFDLLDNSATVLGLIGDIPQVEKDTMMVPGEDVEGRAETALVNSVGDAAIDKYPPATLVDALTGGLLKTDVAAIAMIDGSEVSGIINGYKHGGPIGAVTGGLDGALKGDDVWANQVASGGFGRPMQLFSQGENWVIDKAYGPVSTAASAAVHAATAPFKGAEHLLSRISL